MTSIEKFVKEIENNSIKNEDLIICLEEKKLKIVAMAIFKLIERNYCNTQIIKRLIELGKLLENNKFLGVWQFGHIAIATLAILDNPDANHAYNDIIEKLDDNDKFLIENFIKSESYK